MSRLPMLARVLPRIHRSFQAWLAVALVVAGGLESSALAFPVCTAAEVSARESGCAGGVGPCSITQTFEVGDGCTLDFTTRAVTLTSSAVVRAAVGEQVGAFTVKSGSLTIAGGASLEARGEAATGPQGRGGMIGIVVVGDVVVNRSNSVGRIDVSGHSDAGSVRIAAGGSVTINGRLVADALDNDAGGGGIEIAAANVDASGNSRISAVAGSESSTGGDIQISTSGAVRLASEVDLSGGDGGTLGIISGGEVSLAGVQASAIGDGGSGGCVEVTAVRRTSVVGALLVNGGNSIDGGGCGGAVSIDVDRGDLNVEDNIEADSGAPDGGAGEIDLTTRGALTIASNVTVSAAGTLGDSCGGFIDMVATSLTSLGRMDASGGTLGGSIDLRTAAEMLLDGTLRADGRVAGSCGGCVDIDAGRDKSGLTGAGQLVVRATIDAGGGSCSPSEGCGAGGDADLKACDVTIDTGARILARAAEGGSATITARHSLSLEGHLDVSRTSSTRPEGSVVLTYPPAALSPSDGGDVSPKPTLNATGPCAPAVSTNCLMPCPTCGNGVVEFPEACDGGNATSCDGCSPYCKVESCSDGLLCTLDLCEPQFGCYSSPAPTPCIEPPTVTPTITRTHTPSPSPTVSATITPTPGEPSPTATLSPTVAASATVTVTATSPIIQTPSVTATVTQTQTPTVSPTPAVAGDASCDDAVSAADFPALVAAIVAGESVCGADANKDHRIDADDLEALAARIFGGR